MLTCDMVSSTSREAVSLTDVEFRFCVPMTATRVLDDADIRLFEAVGKASTKVPIVFVATMTDRYLDEQETKVRRELGHRRTDADVTTELQKRFLGRQEQIEAELQENTMTALDATVYVAKGEMTRVKLLQNVA